MIVAYGKNELTFIQVATLLLETTWPYLPRSSQGWISCIFMYFLTCHTLDLKWDIRSRLPCKEEKAATFKFGG